MLVYASFFNLHKDEHISRFYDILDCPLTGELISRAVWSSSFSNQALLPISLAASVLPDRVALRASLNLVIPSRRISTFQQSFQCVTPSFWNSLPISRQAKFLPKIRVI